MEGGLKSTETPRKLMSKTIQKEKKQLRKALGEL